MGSDRGGSRSPDVGLPPGALARRADGLERRRELARALHAPPAPRSRRITERIEELQREIARYRARAIEVHAKLVELEVSRGAVAGDMREKLIDSSVRIARGADELIQGDPPDAGEPRPEPAFTRGR